MTTHQVTVNGLVTAGGIKYTSLCHATSSPVDVNPPICSLRIPNELLFKWNMCGYSSASDKMLIDELNGCIQQSLVAIKYSHDLASRLRTAIKKIKHKRASCTGGRCRKLLMKKEYTLFIKNDEVESFNRLKTQLVEASDASTLWSEVVKEREKEVNELLEAMASDYATFMDEIKQKESEITELKYSLQKDKRNKGKPIHEVGVRQERRKLKEITCHVKNLLILLA